MTLDKVLTLTAIGRPVKARRFLLYLAEPEQGSTKGTDYHSLAKRDTAASWLLEQYRRLEFR